MNEEGLKLCPFCGSKKATVVVHRFHCFETTYGVECPDCSTRISQYFDSRKEATEFWNTRAKGE